MASRRGRATSRWFKQVTIEPLSQPSPDRAPVLTAPVPPVLNAVEMQLASVLQGDR
jgi:hypothetical protein